MRIPAPRWEADDQFFLISSTRDEGLQIVVSIPIEALRQLTQSAILQQVGFGSLLNLTPGGSPIWCAMTPASSASLSLQSAEIQKVRQALEDLAVEFREVLREWRGLILQTDRRCGRYSHGDCDVTTGACP